MIIIPCGAKKLDTLVPVQARFLYTGAFYKCLYNVAITLDPDVRILSAGYGLLKANSMVMPYDLQMTKPRAKQLSQLIERDAEHIAHLLPKTYLLAVQHLKPTRLIPHVTGMGYFMQAAQAIALQNVLYKHDTPNGETAIFIN